jgi:hypothetical protein
VSTNWHPVAEGSSSASAEVGYDQITSPVTVTSTTESAGTTVIACAAHTFSGGRILCEFFCPRVVYVGATDSLTICLFEGSTEITRLTEGKAAALNQINGIGKFRFTPTAGSHTYTVTAFGNVTGSAVSAGNGGTNGDPPAFIRFTND